MKTGLLQPGDPAPLTIKLAGSDGKTHSLADFLGRKTVVFFYPKDNTAGCTAECINISSVLDAFEKLQVNVVGISPDPVEKHEKFIEKHQLKTLLLADTKLEMAQSFGSWGLKKTFGKEYMGLIRSTFLLDENGRILQTLDKIKTKSHGEDLLALLYRM